MDWMATEPVLCIQWTIKYVLVRVTIVTCTCDTDGIVEMLSFLQERSKVNNCEHVNTCKFVLVCMSWWPMTRTQPPVMFFHVRCNHTSYCDKEKNTKWISKVVLCNFGDGGDGTPAIRLCALERFKVGRTSDNRNDNSFVENCRCTCIKHYVPSSQRINFTFGIYHVWKKKWKNIFVCSWLMVVAFVWQLESDAMSMRQTKIVLSATVMTFNDMTVN